MNTQLVESLVQAIRSLSEDERSLFDAKLYGKTPYPSNLELAYLSGSFASQSVRGKAFDFLHDEPDLYTLEDGEPTEWD